MKKKLAVYGALISGVISCSEVPKPTVETKESVQPVATTATQVYIIDTSSGRVLWEGYEGIALGKAEHTGTLGISGGKVNVDSNKVTGGEFIFDMRSLAVTDIPATSGRNAKLRNHLSGGDFFDTEKFPDAKFVITSVEPAAGDSVKISGNLALKGTERNISFPALVIINDSIVTAKTPMFYIDRKDWGMHYKTENSLGDEMIRPEIGIAVSIAAKK